MALRKGIFDKTKFRANVCGNLIDPLICMNRNEGNVARPNTRIRIPVGFV